MQTRSGMLHSLLMNHSIRERELIPALRQACRANGPLHVVVQVLIGVDLRGVPWQRQQLDPILMPGQPCLAPLGLMGRQPVHDQVKLPGRSVEQPLQENDEQSPVIVSL